MLEIRPILRLLSVVGLIGVWLAANNNTKNTTVKKIVVSIERVEGLNDLLTAKEIYEMMNSQSPVDIEGARINQLSLEEMEAIVETDTRIHNAELYVDGKGNLHAKVQQRAPIMRLKTAGGEDYYMDQVGNYIALSKYRTVRVPVFTGHIESYQAGWQEKELGNIYKAFTLAQKINEDSFLKALIEQVHFESLGRIVMIPKIGEEKIVIEHMDDLDDKLENLKIFYRNMAETKEWGKYNEIDISFKNQVVGRP